MLPESYRAEYAKLWAIGDTTTAEHRRAIPDTDETGADVDRWVTIGSFRGTLTEARGQREEVSGEQPHAITNWVWMMQPYDLAAEPVPVEKRLKAKDRLRIGGKDFDVIDGDGGRSGATRLIVQIVAVG